MRISLIFGIILLLLICSAITSFDSYVGLAATLLAIVLLVVFYRSVLKPIRSITNGAELLRAQDFSSRLAHVNQYEADKIIDMFNSMMTALKNERLALLEQNHFLSLITEVSPMGIFTLDDNGRIQTANKAAAQYLGFADSEAITGFDIKSIDSQLAGALTALKQGESDTVRLNDSMIYRCSRLQYMDNGYAHPFLLIEKLTDEVMKAQKKSYEKVIRVIAHEVNNSMAGVNSLLSTTAQFAADPETAEVLGICEERCRALSSFITSLSAVVKIPDACPTLLSLNDLLERSRVILESLCTGRDIKITYSLCPGVLPVNVDSVLFEQVLINIVKNSAESIGSGPGEINIATEYPATLVISDNGAGISSEAADKLFSPFFSTKTDGHGIGLMFISEVLHKHACRFRLATDADGITRFTIRF